MLVPVDGGGGALPEDDFDAIEEAVRETARGRWFLDEFTRRRDAGGTRTILDTLARLERHFAEQQASLPSPQLAKLSGKIARARREIAAAGTSMPDAPELPDDIRIYERLAEQARDAARLAARGHDELQDARRSLTASGCSPDAGEAIDRSADDLRKLVSSQDVLAARLARAMSLMADIDSHLAGHETPEQKLEDKPLAPDSRKYFSAGESIFVPAVDPPKPVQSVEPARPAALAVQPAAQPARGAKLTVRHSGTPESRIGTETAPTAIVTADVPKSAAPAEAPPQPDASGKRRIFIVRRPAGDAVDIPLADDTAQANSAA